MTCHRCKRPLCKPGGPVECWESIVARTLSVEEITRALKMDREWTESLKRGKRLESEA